MEQQRFNNDKECYTDRWHMEQQRLNTDKECYTDRWHMEQQRLNTDKECYTDRWHMEQQRLNNEKECYTDRWHMEQHRLNNDKKCFTDRWHMEQQRLNNDKECYTDRWHMEQHRLNNDKECYTDRWHMEQQRLNNDKECYTDRWHMEQHRLNNDKECCRRCCHIKQQRLNINRACCTDTYQVEKQRCHSKTVCAKCQNQEYSTECRYLDQGLLDQLVKPVVRPNKEVINITGMTGGIINIYHHPTPEDRKSCDRERSINNQETENKCLKENWKSKKSKNPFRKFFCFCRRKKVPSTSPERMKNQIHTAVRHTPDVEISQNEGKDVHADQVHISANVHAYSEIGKAIQPEERPLSQFQTMNKAVQHTTKVETLLGDGHDVHTDRVLSSADVNADFEIWNENQLEEQLTRCNSSHISSRPKIVEYTAAECPKESRLGSNKCITKVKTDIDSPSEKLISEIKEIDGSFEDQCNVFSIRNPMMLQENDAHLQKCQLKKCKVIEPTFKNLSSSFNQLQKETKSEVFQTQNRRSSLMSSVNFEKKIFDVDDESVFDDENDTDDLLREHNEDPSRFEHSCESETEALTDLKHPDPNYKQEETKAKSLVTARDTFTQSLSSVKMPPSGYPWDTSSYDIDGLSIDICNSSDFTRYTETALETGTPFQIRPGHRCEDTENYKKSYKSLADKQVVDTINGGNSCGYYSGKEDQSSSISSSEEGAVCNKNGDNDYSNERCDLRSESIFTQNTSLDPVNSHLHSLSNRKKINEKAGTYGSINTESLNCTTTLQTCSRKETSTSLKDRAYIKEEISITVPDVNVMTGRHLKKGFENISGTATVNKHSLPTQPKAEREFKAVNGITERQNREHIVSLVQNENTSDFRSVPFVDKNKKGRKRNNSESNDSGYESSKTRQQRQTILRREPKNSGCCINEKQRQEENHSVNSVDLLPPKARIPKDRDCTKETLNTPQSKELELPSGLGNQFSSDFQLENKNVWLINSFQNTPLVAVCLGESNFSVIKVSDEGMLQEVEIVLDEDFHMVDCLKTERTRIESKNQNCANTVRLKDTNNENGDDNDGGNSDDDVGGNYDDDVGGNYDEYDGLQSEMTDVDKKTCTLIVQLFKEVTAKKLGRKYFSDTVCDVLRVNLGITKGVCVFSNISAYCALDTTSNNVISSSMQQTTTCKTRKEKHMKRKAKHTKHDNNHHKRKRHDSTRNNLEPRNDASPFYERLPTGMLINNRNVDNSSKLSETTKPIKIKRRKCRYSCRKKVPKPEITSTFFGESINQTFSVLTSGSSKLKSNQRQKNKKSYLKRSWQKDGRLLTWQLTDSGIGISDRSQSSSTQQLKINENSSYFIKFKTEILTKGLDSCKTLPYFVDNTSDFQQLIRRFFTEKNRTFVKNVVRELHIVPRRNENAYGLDSYFDNITGQSRLQYEWLRLESFRNYAGNGSGIVLARNGFYHDHNEGPRATRCYLCNARNSSWEMFDDVRAEHRRQSPDCPFNSDSGQVSQNIPITDNSEASPRTSTQGGSPTTSNNTAFTTSRPADSDLTETSEVEATASFQRLQISGDLSTRGENISQQPTEDRESRDRSLFALPNPRPQNARAGQPYSTFLAPKRNNVATGARSNVVLGEGSSTANLASNSNSQSMLAGPVGAGAFAGLSTCAQIPVSSAAEALQGSSATSAATSTTAGCGPGPPGTGRETDFLFTVVVYYPKHPEYQSIDSRISSYQGWPDYLDQTARQMAEAGFFFVGVADFTRCFCCGGGLRNWEPGDDPMLEHTRWFPRCEYVNKLKGERYVAAVQRRHQEHMAEQQRQQVALAQRRHENRAPPDPMTTDTAEVLLEMGYSAERTREAILAVRQQRGLSDVTAQQVLTWLLDDEERRLNVNTENSTAPVTANTTTAGAAHNVQHTGSSNTVSAENTPETGNEPQEVNETGAVAGPVSNSSISQGKQTEQRQTVASTSTGQQTGALAKPGSASGESDESKSTANGTNNETTKRETKKKKTRKKAKGKISVTASSVAGELDAKSLKAENEKLREMQTCKICMEQPVNTTLLPCGHLVCCGSCAPQLQRCPICRKIIKGTVKTFMS